MFFNEFLLGFIYISNDTKIVGLGPKLTKELGVLNLSLCLCEINPVWPRGECGLDAVVAPVC